ncbi:eukaryotic translation initiation factor 3 subunit A-like protein [Carex littledalei]|uniref:Eukaryotic translation initiation factor 3 subunit A-like protein n=1 Tax=Carex littledalei TaxID=544730 RepID=A0A833RJU6_9POAL|nr:eukaryotic translation initiation factor 3 subunit A-like protein [Carex littledalei]
MAMSVQEKKEKELDPLLKDLTEKKLSFKRNVVSLATELKDVRSRLATQENLFTKEIKTRQEAELKARGMEEEVSKLQNCLLEKDEQLRVSSSTSEQFLVELDDLRSQLSITRATAEFSAESAESARAQCSSLVEELNEKRIYLKQHEDRVNRLGEQVENLQKLLEARELSQRKLRGDVFQMEKEIASAVSKAKERSDTDTDRECELRRVLEDVSSKNIENLNRHMSAKDDEIARLRDEIRILSVHWINKTKELESQLEKQRRTDQELKKKILKLEFCLQESRSQMRKLQRMGERRDRALKELRDQMAMKQPYNTSSTSDEKNNFWESSGFKFMVSISMLALVIVAKR